MTLPNQSLDRTAGSAGRSGCIERRGRALVALDEEEDARRA